MTMVEDLHLLVIDRCHPDGECPAPSSDPDAFLAEGAWLPEPGDCWDPQWEVLHPPTCVHPNGLADEDNPSGPSERCGLDYDVMQEGDDAFDLVKQEAWTVGRPGIADRLPSGRYLVRWYYEDLGWNWEHTEHDFRSGIELVEGPVWDGDREGWDRA